MQRDVRPPQFGFVMEQTLGHVTHYKNLRTAVDADPAITAAWYPLSFAPEGRIESLPLLRDNWTVRASRRTRRELETDSACRRHDALFFHTQVTTLFSASLMRRVPSVISLDATPINYDMVGAAYGHRQVNVMVEKAKRRLNIRSLREARALVTWCDWARQSLVHDYGIERSRITVIPPGVNLDAWPCPAARDSSGPVRILFVGGDFERKGGENLLRAFTELDIACELHVVTKEPCGDAPGLFVHRDVAPNSDLLRRLYATADIFALPTLADCFPLVIQEAMAAGLPVVATDVGAIREAVHDGETGLLVPPGNIRALRLALQTLIGDADRRKAMGAHGRSLAEERFDSTANAMRILSIMRELVATERQVGAIRRPQIADSTLNTEVGHPAETLTAPTMPVWVHAANSGTHCIDAPQLDGTHARNS